MSPSADAPRYIVTRESDAWSVVDTRTMEPVIRFDITMRHLAELDAAARNRGAT